MSQFLRNTFIWLFIAGATFALQNFNQGQSSENMTYSEFVSLVNKDQFAVSHFKAMDTLSMVLKMMELIYHYKTNLCSR